MNKPTERYLVVLGIMHQILDENGDYSSENEGTCRIEVSKEMMETNLSEFSDRHLIPMFAAIKNKLKS